MMQKTLDDWEELRQCEKKVDTLLVRKPSDHDVILEDDSVLLTDRDVYV